MPFMLGIILIAVLVFAFRKVRAGYEIVHIENVTKIVKRVAPPQKAPPARDVDIWMKNQIRDVRRDRGRHIEDAPNYTSYTTEQTGKFKIPTDFPTDGTGKFKLPQ